MCKDLEHKKNTTSLFEPQVADAANIETETQATNNEFSELKQEFDNVIDASTEQKIQTDAINLVDDILHEDKPFKHIDTEDIWTEGNLFGNDDKRAVTDAVK